MEAKICSNPQCCEFTSDILEGSSECIKCMSYEPRERKRYKKLDKQVFEEKFNDHRAKAKEKKEREFAKRRKQREHGINNFKGFV